MDVLTPTGRHSTTCPCQLRRLRRLQITCVIGIVCGSLCLFTGIGLIFTFFLTPPAETAPIGSRVGAGLCGVGVIIISASTVCLWKWQTKLNHLTKKLLHPNHSSLGTGSSDRCVFDHPTAHSFDLRDYESVSHVLKKANSTVYIAPATAAAAAAAATPQSDRLKLVGVLHGTISTSEIHGSAVWKRTTDVPSDVELKASQTEPVDKPRLGLRDHCLRRSLPRVLLHSHSKTNRNCERDQTSSPVFAKLAKSESEGRDMTGLKDVTCVRKSSQPVGHVPGEPDANKTPDPTVPGLDRSSCASGRRFLLMNQTGQVISCTTLFDPAGEDNEDEVLLPPPPPRGCRQATPCGGWSFFPVYVEQPNGWTDSAASDEDVAARRTRVACSAGSEPQRSCATLNSDGETSERRCAAPQRSARQSVMQYVRKVWCFLQRARRRDAPANTDASRQALDEVQSLLPVPAPQHDDDDEPNVEQSKRRSAPRSFCAGQAADNTVFGHSPTNAADPARSQSIRSRLGRDEQPVANNNKNNNASVFSLPAAPLDRWSADRPLWIMGVPVPDEQWLAIDHHHHHCDLILLRGRRPRRQQQQQQTSDRAGSVDSVKPTGSWSSVYAFHVRPPARLKRLSRTRLATSRAASCAAVRVR